MLNGSQMTCCLLLTYLGGNGIIFQEDRLEKISARDTRDISFFWLTLSPWFDMLHIVINLIHQGVPICDISTTLLKVGRLDNVLEKHRVEMKGIIRSPHGYQVFGAIVLRIHREYRDWSGYHDTHHRYGTNKQQRILVIQPYIHTLPSSTAR